MDPALAAAVSVRCDHTAIDCGIFTDTDDRAAFDLGFILSRQHEANKKNKHQCHEAQSFNEFFIQYLLPFNLFSGFLFWLKIAI
jgi:hypothetical protein